MVTRACISINNRCNLNCTYCHFHEKKDYIQEDNMDVITILDIIASHIEDNDIDLFKLGFVDSNREMIPLEGDIPSPVHPPKGCKFHTRCKYCTEICKHITPELVEMRPGHFVACHNPLGVEKDS